MIPELVDKPAQLHLDMGMLRLIQPELFRVPGLFSRVLSGFLRFTSGFGPSLAPKGWIGRLLGVYDPDGQAEAIESLAWRFWHFQVEPGLVVSESPCKIAVYSSIVDSVMLLRVDEKAESVLTCLGGQPRVGQRFLVIFGYDQIDHPSGDLGRGPFSIFPINEAWPVLVDWLVSDQDALERAKKTIPDFSWNRCLDLGKEKMESGALCRDARPWYSRISTKEQKCGGEYKVLGGYWT